MRPITKQQQKEVDDEETMYYSVCTNLKCCVCFISVSIYMYDTVILSKICVLFVLQSPDIESPFTACNQCSILFLIITNQNCIVFFQFPSRHSHTHTHTLHTQF